MNSIGGYFELELKRGSFPHGNGLLVNSGRHALEAILKCNPQIKRIFIPDYSCEAILEPIDRLGIERVYYPIDENLEIKYTVELGAQDILLYTNYFGIKDEYVSSIVQEYSGKIIIDNAQAFYAQPLNDAPTIYSPRKFVGVPDGGIAYGPGVKTIEQEIRDEDISYERCGSLLKRIELGAQAGYNDFRSASSELSEVGLRKMSKLTRALLGSIDYQHIKEVRKSNFLILHNALKDLNLMCIPPSETFECPMVYPLLLKNGSELRQRLIEERIYVATYWPNVLRDSSPASISHQIARDLVPLPIDQRYTKKEMERIISIIKL